MQPITTPARFGPLKLNVMLLLHMLCYVVLCYVMFISDCTLATAHQRRLVSANSLGPLEEVPVAPPRTRKRQSMPHFNVKLDADDVTRSPTPKSLSQPECECPIQPEVEQIKTQCGRQQVHSVSGAGSSISSLFTKLIGKFRVAQAQV